MRWNLNYELRTLHPDSWTCFRLLGVGSWVAAMNRVADMLDQGFAAEWNINAAIEGASDALVLCAEIADFALGADSTCRVTIVSGVGNWCPILRRNYLATMGDAADRFLDRAKSEYWK